MEASTIDGATIYGDRVVNMQVKNSDKHLAAMGYKLKLL